MNRDDLESLTHRSLAELPPPKAPRTLAPRVMAQVRRQHRECLVWPALDRLAPGLASGVGWTALRALCFGLARRGRCTWVFRFLWDHEIGDGDRCGHRYFWGAGGQCAHHAACDSGADCRTSHGSGRDRVHGERISRRGVGPLAPGKGGWTMKFAWGIWGLLLPVLVLSAGCGAGCGIDLTVRRRRRFPGFWKSAVITAKW